MKHAVIIFSALIILAGCSGDGDSGIIRFFKSLLAGGGKAVPVTVTTPTLTERTIDITVAARLKPSDRIEVRLPNDARIERVFVAPGDAVRAGDAVAEISTEEISLKLGQNRADLADAEAKLEKNTYFLNNRDRLLADGRIDRVEYDSLESDVADNNHAVETLRATIAALESQLDKTTVASPAAGVIDVRAATPGTVTAANTPLAVISVIDPLSVEFDLPTDAARTVQPGQSIALSFATLPAERAAAQITSVGTEVNRETGNVTVRASLANNRGIYKSGMEAQATITGSHKQRSLVIPAEAVVEYRRQNYVFTVDHGIAHRARIVLRSTHDGIAEVVEGLKEDDVVVVKGNADVSEGAVVDIWGR